MQVNIFWELPVWPIVQVNLFSGFPIWPIVQVKIFVLPIMHVIVFGNPHLAHYACDLFWGIPVWPIMQMN